MDLGIKGKRALVGGASKGLGFAAARSFCEEGAEVVIAARNKDELTKAAEALEEETGARVHPIPADLTKEDERARLFQESVRLMGGVDILLANAGGPPPGPFTSHGPENWRLAIDLALGNITHLAALALPGMKERGFGRIAQIVSIAGLEALDGLILSNASRPAVLGFAKALAREVAKDGILVNSICPGVFLTDRMKELAKERSKRAGVTPEEFLDGFCADIPLGRPGDPKELGDLAAFLCSPRNTYITGAAIPVDGAKTRRLF